MKQRFHYGPWLVAGLLVMGAALVWHYYPRTVPPKVAAAPLAPAPLPPPVSAPAPVDQAPKYPIEQVPVLAVDAAPLPALNASDAEAFAALQSALGASDAGQFVVREFLVPRLVATIDNLPRKSLTRAIYAGRPAAGELGVTEADGRLWLDEANAARYDLAVSAFESLDARQLVTSYVRFYPLLQQAYRDLGESDRQFNDRLVEVIDHLLAAPERPAAVELRRIPGRPRLAFADPAMESASVGHKAMWRLSPEQAQRVKARLRELRTLVAGQRPAG
ncbi:DUF3014 domain-containing protein [Arenimonas sp. MALMAid1274]|uniref:DUF3014 domain-containing protein n=1 Tax=Arenimonas sp. MALMAid1274 TaxID=3411630 RepID=UPI003BA3A400